MRKSFAIIGGFILLLPAGLSCATTCIAPPPLKPVHHVCGVVIDPSGGPVSNARVAILNGGREVASLQTGEDGKFSFDQLSAGHYDIQVGATGFVTALSSIVLVKPAPKSNRALQVHLDVGMGCSPINEVKSKTSK
jgi:Carboxypeptidase regulatory-like domain